MRPGIKSLAPGLDEPYRSRAAPVGSARYWSLLFAAPAERAALLGIYALLAEWRALMQPGGEAVVAHTKLAWWREEMSRLAGAAAGSGAGAAAVHPISRYLRSLPGAARADFAPLAAAVEAAAQQATGVPLERAAHLGAHAGALLGGPLLVASALAQPPADPIGPPAHTAPLEQAVRALSVADYLARALVDYRRDASAGRIAFPVDSLLEDGIENQDLLAATPPPHLRTFLERTRAYAQAQYRAATSALAEPQSEPQSEPRRGLRVLAGLGEQHLREGRSSPAHTPRLKDLLRAWRAARAAPHV
jgi:phytoene synthase